MALSLEDQATLTQRLADASLAYHRLMTGRLASTVVDQNGERVTFSAANADQLKAYIDDLKSQLGLVDKSAMPTAFKFIF
jgi:predicted regulator of Ras-like GTPase activity (Roadblock/LC7/MglB family)